MRKEDVKIGMEVEIKGFYKQSFPIIKIDGCNITIKGKFSNEIPLDQTVQIPITELINGSFEGKKFTIKDFPKWDEEMLVSDDGDAWFIRSFDSFCESEIGYVYTRLQSNDKKMQYDSNGESVGDSVKWKMYKRFNIIK
jgi:hypothetical protein